MALKDLFESDAKLCGYPVVVLYGEEFISHQDVNGILKNYLIPE